MKPIEEVLFRCSGIGALMTQKQGTTFTPVMEARIKELLQEKLTGLNANGNKVKFEGTKKPEELSELIKKRDAPPELSETAKAFVRKVWLKNEKGIYHDIKSKFLDKGIFNEEDAITLISEVDGIMYSKNDERRKNDYTEGECDIFKDLVTKKVVHDTKCSWSAETFMAAEPTINNIWQGVGYMELWDADEFHLRYCLVDCPPHLLQKEKDNAKYKYYSGDMTDAELDLLEKSMEPIYEQIERNLVYSNNPAFNKEERVKTFIFYRDKVKMAEMKEAVKLAREYYKTITLNGKN
jgi:hypothetical protein